MTGHRLLPITANLSNQEMERNMQTEAEVTDFAGDVRKLRSDRGAVGTEMAIVVAIVVAIALALGAVMFSSAEAHQECIPETPGAAVGAGCDSIVD